MELDVGEVCRFVSEKFKMLRVLITSKVYSKVIKG